MRSGQIVFMAIHAPMPLPTASDDLAQRIARDGYDQACGRWRCHVSLSSLHVASSRQHASDTADDIMCLARALASTWPVDAVSWSGSGLFIPAWQFLEGTASDLRPMPLLVALKVLRSQSSGASRITASTQGLTYFGLPELRDLTGDADLNGVRRRLLNLGSYLIAHGPVIRDGDTLGSDENRSVQVRHETDASGQPVLTLHSQQG